jgi:hypothetical protein
MQRQKIFFIILVLLGSLSAGYFSIRSAGALFDFIMLKERAEAHITRWEIKETKGKFPLKGYYSFEAKGHVWKGVTLLTEPWYLNEASAVSALQEKAKQKWTVWYCSNNPSQSSLEKEFPSGLVVRTLVCYGVFAYFILFFRRFLKNNYD